MGKIEHGIAGCFSLASVMIVGDRVEDALPSLPKMS